MPQDWVQVALEHHRAGRFTDAESAYRKALDSNPDDPEAPHWLGVLMHQAKRSQEAIRFLERAVQLRPDDAAYRHNLGHAYLARRQHANAIAAFQKAVEIDPSRPEAWMALGVARLARGDGEDREAAVGALKAARDRGLDSAELYRQLGAATLIAGRVDEAIDAYRQAIGRDPNDAPTYFHLALAHQARAQPVEVRKALLKAAEAEPRFAPAWYGLGVLEAESSRWELAAAMFRRAIAVRDDYAAAYRALGQVLEAAGKEEEAQRVGQQAEWAARESARAANARLREQGSVEELERRLTPDNESRDLQFGLASALRLMPPAAVPADSLVELFDKYADNFDRHLREQLQYRLPEMLGEAIASLGLSLASLDILDLGCGTGLCGAAVKPLAKILVGVDLSPGMIQKARERGIYDRLEVGDLVAVTQALPPRSFDLVICAEVLNYIGDLLPTFQAIAAALRPGGRFALSVEAGAGERYDLQPNRRYRHAKAYVQRLAAMQGFVEERFDLVPLRLEKGAPVAGHLVILRLPS
jgi:predicted TPR repeat methyltransferase